jgi:lauroyl/myristoyl acyltransferase
MQKRLDNACIDGENILERNMLGDGKVVVLSLHYGVWELLPAIFARRGYPVCVGNGLQPDAQFGAELGQLRSGQGVTLTSNISEMRQALVCRSLVGFVLDNTRVTQGERCDAMWPGFEVLRTPFTLARQSGASLVPMLARQDSGQVSVKIGEPVATAEQFGAWARRELVQSTADWVLWGKRGAEA